MEKNNKNILAENAALGVNKALNYAVEGLKLTPVEGYKMVAPFLKDLHETIKASAEEGGKPVNLQKLYEKHHEEAMPILNKFVYALEGRRLDTPSKLSASMDTPLASFAASALGTNNISIKRTLDPSRPNNEPLDLMLQHLCYEIKNNEKDFSNKSAKAKVKVKTK